MPRNRSSRSLIIGSGAAIRATRQSGPRRRGPSVPTRWPPRARAQRQLLGGRGVLVQPPFRRQQPEPPRRPDRSLAHGSTRPRGQQARHSASASCAVRPLEVSVCCHHITASAATTKRYAGRDEPRGQGARRIGSLRGDQRLARRITAIGSRHSRAASKTLAHLAEQALGMSSTSRRRRGAVAPVECSRTTSSTNALPGASATARRRAAARWLTVGAGGDC